MEAKNWQDCSMGKMLATKPDNLGHKEHRKEGTNAPKLSSDFHTHTGYS